MKAITANTIVTTLNEIVNGTKVIPIGDKPKNSPTKPAIPKLNATDKTTSSTGSKRFLPTKSMLTKQYPGRKTTKTMPNKKRKTTSKESLGMIYANANVNSV